jgi:hypothetical protein
MGRNWISVPIPHTRIRVGRSVSDSELFGTSQKREALPSWVRYEIREHMQKAAKARGETLTNEYCNYKIDKAFALGELDVEGRPTIHASGDNADELARQFIDGAAKWGAVISVEAATQKANEFIREIEADRRRAEIWRAIRVAAIAVAVGVVFYLSLAHAGTCRIYGEGTDTVEPARMDHSSSGTATATGAFMASQTPVLSAIQAKTIGRFMNGMMSDKRTLRSM